MWLRDQQQWTWHDDGSGSADGSGDVGGPHTWHCQGRQVGNMGEKHCHCLRLPHRCYTCRVVSAELPVTTERKTSKDIQNKNQLQLANRKANLKRKIFCKNGNWLAAMQTSWQTFLIVCSRCYRLCCETLKDWQSINQRIYAHYAVCRWH